MNNKYSDCDFSGYATRNDLTCSDGRIIKKDAFKDNDGKKVSLVFDHVHNDVNAVLGHAYLENRDDGVYAYGYFNDTESGNTAKKLVSNGDIKSLSIWANKLRQKGPNVTHGDIKELSLVLAGANPGAYIDYVMAHSADGKDTDELAEVYACYDEPIMCGCSDMTHSDDKGGNSKNMATNDTINNANNKAKSEDTSKTIGEIVDTMTPEQKDALFALVGMVIDSKDDSEEGDDNSMKHNVFDTDNNNSTNVLSHDEMATIIADGKRCGSLKESVLSHAEEYGIDQIDWLFPEATNLNNPPEFIKRDTSWVTKVMSSVHHSPFSRIKSMFANITEDDARAKGYIKGNYKKEEVFTLLKRTTIPTTVYKKQKLDRDDQIDITDFDVVAWLKAEMRMMLDEELARAYLIGDGRLSSSDDKINESNIRPIAFDEDLLTIKKIVTYDSNATDSDKAKAFIKTVIKSRKDYKGSGEPTLFCTEDLITDMLLIEDTTGRSIYDSVDKLKNVLRVKDIVAVPVMEGVKGKNGGNLLGIIVNLADYNVGADKGGAINMFDDFDIDYNQQKYLIETRCSGALTKPYSAIAIEASKS